MERSYRQGVLSSRRTAVRAPFAALLAAFGLLLAGCGGGPKQAGVANLGTTSTASTAPGSPASPGGANAGDSGSSQTSGGGPINGISVAGNPAEMLAFSSCMRSHGVPGFPDPNAQGAISYSGARGAQFQKATEACQKYAPSGGPPPTPAQQAQMRQQALAFSACMRAHGLPNFPDPVFSNDGRSVGIRISAGSGIDPGSPQFEAAQKACQADMPSKAGQGPVTANAKAGGG